MSRPPHSTADRVRLAIERSNKTLKAIGAEIGCSHATLSQWQSGETDLTLAKVKLVLGFCESTNVALDWLLTGNGEPTPRKVGVEHPLVQEARHIADQLPQIAEQAHRVLVAMEGAPPWRND